MEERVPLSKSESIFLQPDFPGVEQLDIFAGLILLKYLVLRNMGVLRFGLAGWAQVWFRGGAHFWFGGRVSVWVCWWLIFGWAEVGFWDWGLRFCFAL